MLQVRVSLKLFVRLRVERAWHIYAPELSIFSVGVSAIYEGDIHFINHRYTMSFLHSLACYNCSTLWAMVFLNSTVASYGATVADPFGELVPVLNDTAMTIDDAWGGMFLLLCFPNSLTCDCP